MYINELEKLSIKELSEYLRAINDKNQKESIDSLRSYLPKESQIVSRETIENRLLRNLIKDYYNRLDLEKVKEEFLVKGLLNRNQKLEKGLPKDILIYGLELLPADYTPGINLCPKAGTCKDSCLAFSGFARYQSFDSSEKELTLNVVLKARARRTFLFKNDRKFFEEILKMEIEYNAFKAKKANTRTFFRLNVFSDINFTKLIKELPEISFYDYTKDWKRSSFSNYHLTYSSSEKVSEKDILSKLESGSNVAMVFPKVLPEFFKGFKVINGDINDLRVYDSNSVIVGLTLKGTIGSKSKKVNSFSESSSLL